MKRKSLLAGACAAALVAAMGIAPAGAYFTDSSSASGSITVNVQPSTDIDEDYGNRVKHVVVSNAADSATAVFVRARVYSSIEYTAAGSGWAPGADGWFEFANPVDPGQQTDELTVGITFPVTEGQGIDGAVEGDNYNVVVVYETTPVQYDEAGNAFADWSFILDSGN